MPPATEDIRPTDDEAPGGRPRWLVPVAVLAAVGAAIGLWLTQPWLLLVDTVAEESLPVTAPATSDAESDDPVDDETTTDPAAAMDEESAAGDADGGATAGDAGSAVDEVDEESSATPRASSSPSAPPTPAGPVELAAGSFISRDHGTSGEASIVELEDGTRVLAIEGLSTDNGPDLFVYLDDTPADGPEGEFDDGVNLGRLRANQGDLLYEIPADLDLEDVRSVGIWCDRFSSLFGAADLVPPA